MFFQWCFSLSASHTPSFWLPPFDVCWHRLSVLSVQGLNNKFNYTECSLLWMTFFFSAYIFFKTHHYFSESMIHSFFCQKPFHWIDYYNIFIRSPLVNIWVVSSWWNVINNCDKYSCTSICVDKVLVCHQTFLWILIFYVILLLIGMLLCKCSLYIQDKIPFQIYIYIHICGMFSLS